MFCPGGPPVCDMFGSLCGHTLLNLSASRTPFQDGGPTGGLKRSLPIGGAAYGTPRYASTGCSCWRWGWTMTPRSVPDDTRITRGLARLEAVPVANTTNNPAHKNRHHRYKHGAFFMSTSMWIVLLLSFQGDSEYRSLYSLSLVGIHLLSSNKSAK